MTKSELQRLIKIEARMHQIATEEMGLKYCPIEFDIIPPQKMLEIMAYRSPTNISNWKYGRDYERQRTIFEHFGDGLPYEVVLNSNPSRAYLMKSNTFAVQCLVMAHVIGHVNFFTENKHFNESRKDIINVLAEASKRFNLYERKFGIDEVEKIIDAGHAIQLHSSPFDKETEEEKRERIWKQKRLEDRTSQATFSDITGTNVPEINEDIALHNEKLLRELRLQTPVEPTEDLLRYIIDNSRILENWSIDILETLRMEGQYYWPIIKTKFMNEGWATYIHEKIMGRLFEEGLLDNTDHAQYNYSNSLVKAQNPVSLNPYLVGSEMWKDIKNRWDKGLHGRNYENCGNVKEKENWNTKEMKGDEKIFQIMRSHTDWFFMQEFLTPELVRDLEIYLYMKKDNYNTIDYVITEHEAKEIRDLIVNSFAHSGIPKIEIIDGNNNDRGEMVLEHSWAGATLDRKYTEETLKHIWQLWGNKIHLKTRLGERTIIYTVDNGETKVN